jgi:hypothetical protein
MTTPLKNSGPIEQNAYWRPMRFASGRGGPAEAMTVKRTVAAAIVLVFSSILGSCGSFSGYVSDHWPHWAGGMPDDVPPRPGAPGYDEFVAHGQSGQDATNKTSPSGASPVFTATKTHVQPATAAPAQAAPAEAAPVAAPASDRPAEDPSAVKGGLY